VRALGEPTGGRRLTEEQNTAEEPEQTGAARRNAPTLNRPSIPRRSEEVGGDATADERTSPFPYAESFDEWVADETASPEVERRRETGDGGD
jgi:hypothetical protein